MQVRNNIFKTSEQDVILQNYKVKLETAHKKIFALTRELQEQLCQHKSENVTLTQTLQKTIAELEQEKNKSIKLQKNFRNSRERAARFKKRIGRLEQELAATKV